ncbi:MAG: small multi-drug export protein [Oscillospiraceae bacterium]|nr:small multi-drug export protein [Oscillospiraceae bacterium]
MLPLIELRGAMIYAAVAEMPFLPSLICCVIGNILPVPFLIKFAKTVLVYLSKVKKIGWIFQKIIDHGNKKAKKVDNAEMLGLFFFVAFPIPGTGAWTASLIATLMQLRVWKSTLIILLGVITCGIIMGFLSFGIADLLM